MRYCLIGLLQKLILTSHPRPVDIVVSSEGRKVQEQVWSEILEVLQKAVPEVTQRVKSMGG